jgi:hypothetical protein
MKFTSVFSTIAAGLVLATVNSVSGQTCPTVSCTNTISGGTITVDSGKVFCLNSGSWSGGVTLKKGGVIYVAPGANFNVSYTTGVFDGTLINCGTSSVALWGGANYTTIKNYGTFNSGGIQGFRGSIENYSTMSWSQMEAFGATILNKGTMTASNTQINNSNFTNSGTVNATANFLLKNNGTLTNTVTGIMNLNVNNWGGTEFGVNVDNLGKMIVNNPNSGSGISKTVHNLGYMKLTGQVTVGSSAYFTNDSLLEIVPSNPLNLAGALMQNNNKLYVTGSFHLNNPNSELVNNGKMRVSGGLHQNAAGSKLINNCNIVTNDFIVGPGNVINKGLIWALNDVQINGSTTTATFYNDTFAMVRGKNFVSSGAITGYGSFYFTHTTNFNTAGTMIGSSNSLPIQFYDVNPSGPLFDQFNNGNTPVNTIRPASMVPADTTGYVCGESEDVAGFPPTAGRVNRYLCANGPLDIDLSEYVAPHPPIVSKSFVLETTSVKLYDYDNPNNPTNHTNSLVIPNKGTLTFNPTTAILTFVPEPSFTQGQVLAQYVIANTSTTDPAVYPSARTTISITVQPPTVAPAISIIPQQ